MLVQPHLVVPLFLDQNVSHAKGQSAVRTRQRRQVPIRAACRERAAWIDDDELAPFTLSVAQERHEMRRGADWVVSPEDHELTVEHIGVRRTPAFANRRLDGM